jgi:carbon monoxide dehydrogenase subunit G
MTVRVEREIDVPADPETVWDFVADPEHRARAISVVRDFEERDDGTEVWHVRLPIPLIDRTVAVETTDDYRDPPRQVAFTGRSRALTVRGEHEPEPIDAGTRLTSRFVVDGRLPGVERYFTGHLDDELDNLESALLAYVTDRQEERS